LLPALAVRAVTTYRVTVRRILKPLAFLFVAAQLLLAVPAVAAASVPSATSYCEGGASHPDKCPCCPGESMKDCLTACTVIAAMPASLSLPVFSPAHGSASSPEPFFAAISSDPPLKPPPIA
jgi:hypothetical protein